MRRKKLLQLLKNQRIRDCEENIKHNFDVERYTRLKRMYEEMSIQEFEKLINKEIAEEKRKESNCHYIKS